MNATRFDYILVGGGLQSGLIALALRHHQPEASVLLIERSIRLGGNHTWSFHPGDIPGSATNWVKSLVEYRWPQCRVRLPQFMRVLDLEYATISSERFSDVVRSLFSVERGTASTDCSSKSFDDEVASTRDAEQAGLRGNYEFYGKHKDFLFLETPIVELSAQHVRTATGQAYCGRLVIDNRGPQSDQKFPFRQTGFQKFYGFEVKLQSDWPHDCPTIMDSCMDQSDGFHFMYTLPFESRRVLVENTRFSDTSTLDRDECLAQTDEYLSSMGFKTWRILREESGVLPMPISGEKLPAAGQPLSGGYAGGWFHAATGYSFPLAVAFAEAIANSTPEMAFEAIDALARSHSACSRFARFLNRLLFRLVRPATRFQIFRRFYRVLSEEAIARFYAHRFTMTDAFRIVVGMPPSGLQPVRFLRSFFSPTQSLSAPKSALPSASVVCDLEHSS